MMVPGLSGANLISYLLRLGELMFEKLFSAAPDEILELMQAFRSDPRPNKIDLGVGVYKDHNGYTPIMKAIKIADVQELGDVMISQLTDLFSEKNKKTIH